MPADRRDPAAPRPDPLPAPGAHVGPYRVERELGRGGMGAVYAASTADGRRVALKLILAGADGAALARFRREALAAGRLRHPGIVAVHDAGVDAAGRPYVAMELVDGESAEARAARGPLPAREAARIAAGVARALAHAHALGVLHRDVKPHNVLLAADGRVALSDFGLARDAHDARLTATGELLGTPSYMAPEQAAGERAAVDARADVYGLGATLHHLLTGRPPFEGATVVNVVSQVLTRAPAPAGVDPALDALVLRCLAKDPAARFPDAAALAEALEAWLARADAPPPRRPPRALRAVAALLALLAVVALAAAGRPDPAPPPPAPPPPALAPVAPPPLPPPPPRRPAPDLPPLPADGAALVATPDAAPPRLELRDAWLVEPGRDGWRLHAGPQDRPAVLVPLAWGGDRLEVRADLTLAVCEPTVPVAVVLRTTTGSAAASVALVATWVETPGEGLALAHRLTLFARPDRKPPHLRAEGPPRLLPPGPVSLTLVLVVDPARRRLSARVEGLGLGLAVDPLVLDWTPGAGQPYAACWVNPNRDEVTAPPMDRPHEYTQVVLRRLAVLGAANDLGSGPGGNDADAELGRTGPRLWRGEERAAALDTLEGLLAASERPPPLFEGGLRFASVVFRAAGGAPAEALAPPLVELRERAPLFFEARWRSGLAALPPAVRGALRALHPRQVAPLAALAADDALEAEAPEDFVGTGATSQQGKRAPLGRRDLPLAALLLDEPADPALAVAAARAWLHAGAFEEAARRLRPAAADDPAARRLLGYAYLRQRAHAEAEACWRGAPPGDDDFGRRLARLARGLAAHPR